MNDEQINILMVEDNTDHAILAKMCLERQPNYYVKIVSSSEGCLAALKKEQYNIVLLDYNLPMEDGLSILKRLQKQSYSEAPVVLVTGHGHEKVAVEAMKAGAFDYVVKSGDYPGILPIVVKRVTDKFRIYKEKKRMEAELIIRNDELEVINAISEVVNQSLIVEEILRGAVAKLVEKLKLDAGAVYLALPGSDAFSKKASMGAFDQVTDSLSLALAETVTINDLYAKTAAPLFGRLGKAGQEFDAQLLQSGLKALIAVPLKHKSDLLGVLFLGSSQPDVFGPRRVNLLSSISNQISIAVENSKLYLQTEKLKNNFENVLDSSLDLIVTIASDGTINFCNLKFANFFGYSIDEVPGRNILDFIPEHLTDFIKSKLGELKSGKASVYETEIRLPGGQLRACLISQSTLKGRDKFLMVIKDISEIAKLQKQLIQSEKLSALGQMISGAAHELNNPLAGILGYSQLLLEEPIENNVRKDIEVILHEAKRCQNIVRNLLTFARKSKHDRQPIDINEVLSSVLDLNQYQLKLDFVELVRDFDSRLPKVIGDFQQLQQVFLQLMYNAHDALTQVERKNKEIRVVTRATDNAVQVQIIDNGKGIPKKYRDKIFDPFFTTKEVGEGTGLGLSICFGIVKSHMGKMTVESNLNEGTIFTVELPLPDERAATSNGSQNGKSLRTLHATLL